MNITFYQLMIVLIFSDGQFKGVEGNNFSYKRLKVLRDILWNCDDTSAEMIPKLVDELSTSLRALFVRLIYVVASALCMR